MTTAEEYQGLADAAYRVDRLRQDPPLVKGEPFRLKIDPSGTTQLYEVLDSENHEANGFQAMAVAPVVNGAVDTSHVVVVYAGTTPDHRADMLENITPVVGGKRGPGSQVLDVISSRIGCRRSIRGRRSRPRGIRWVGFWPCWSRRRTTGIRRRSTHRTPGSGCPREPR